MKLNASSVKSLGRDASNESRRKKSVSSVFERLSATQSTKKLMETLQIEFDSH